MMRKYSKIVVVWLLSLSFGFSCILAEENFSWEDCVREAAKNHPDLIAAQQEVKQSEAAKKITASGLYPQADAVLDASVSRTDNGKSHSTADAYSYGVSGSQLLFDGFKTASDLEAAAEDIKAIRQKFRFTSATVRFRLRSAFISLLKAQETLRIADEIFNIRRASLELITLRYESGLEHKGALLTAEASLAEAEYDISKAKRGRDAARRELLKEIGRSEPLEITLKSDFTVKKLVPDRPDFAALSVNNPYLLQLAAEKNAADFALKSASADFYPALSAKAGASRSGSDWMPDNGQWNLGLSLSLPLFEGGLRSARVSRAEALSRQLKANQRSSKDGVVLALEQAWAALRDAVDYLQVKKKSLYANEQRLVIAEAQYSAGFIGFDDWIIIQDNLVKAKKAFLDAQANALLAEAAWAQAKGETLENV